MDSNNVNVYQDKIISSLAWKRDDLTTSDWKIKLPDQVLGELERLISFLRVNPTPLEVLDPKDFELGECNVFRIYLQPFSITITKIVLICI